MREVPLKIPSGEAAWKSKGKNLQIDLSIKLEIDKNCYLPELFQVDGLSAPNTCLLGKMLRLIYVDPI